MKLPLSSFYYWLRESVQQIQHMLACGAKFIKKTGTTLHLDSS